MSEGADGAFVLKPGEGRSIDLGGFRMSVKATDDQTNGAFTLPEAQEPAGFGPPLHIHRDAAEAFYVLEGEYIICLDGREASCPHVAPPTADLRQLNVGSFPSRRAGLLHRVSVRDDGKGGLACLPGTHEAQPEARSDGFNTPVAPARLGGRLDRDQSLPVAC